MDKAPNRFFGLDIHKESFVTVGVNLKREIVFGPQKASNYYWTIGSFAICHQRMRSCWDDYQRVSLL